MKYCIYCNNPLEDSAQACPRCGNVQVQPNQFNIQQGYQQNYQQNAYPQQQYTGYPQYNQYPQYPQYEEPEIPMPRSYPEEKVVYPKRTAKEVLVQVFGTLIAFIVLISLLLAMTVVPIVSYDAAVGDSEFSIELSGLDMLRFARFALIPAEGDDLEKEKRALEDAYPFYELNAPEQAKEMLKKLVLLEQCIAFKNNSTDSILQITFFAILWIASAVLAVITAGYMIHAIIGLFSRKYGGVAYEGDTVRFATPLVGLVIVLTMFAPYALDIVLPVSLSTSLWLAIGALVFIAAFLVINCLFPKGEKDKKSVLTTALAAGLCFIIILSCVLPYVMGVGIKDTVDGTEFYSAHYGSEYFKGLYEYEDETEGGFDGGENDSLDERKQKLQSVLNMLVLVDGEAGQAQIQRYLMLYSLSTTGMNKYIEVFSVLPMVRIMAVLFTSLLLSEYVKYLTVERTNRKLLKHAKRLTVVFAALAFFTTAFFAVCAGSALAFANIGYYILPSIPTLLMVPCTALIMILKGGKPEIDLSSIKRPYMYQYKHLEEEDAK